ncbi:hypothetical protein CTI12_AA132600 [Artemisia annua]|uniref:Uncharacterized protein n=1 Tax=Artemisia annua TaxID=35608 RepID=A0A2U1PB46_ARTAN|nr:hypothetical protein CTI12_AA132600 [Artemisia annua]
MAIYIGTEKEEWGKVLETPFCMDLVLEGFGAEPIAEYGAYSKIPKDLRKQIFTWLRKQPGYYEMLVAWSPEVLALGRPRTSVFLGFLFFLASSFVLPPPE